MLTRATARVPHPRPLPQKLGEGRVCQKGRGASPHAPSDAIIPSPRAGRGKGEGLWALKTAHPVSPNSRGE